jgi:hypothetical protein
MLKDDKNVTLQRMSLRAKRGNPVIKMPLMKSAGLPRRCAPRNDHLFGSGSSGLGLQSQSLRVGARFIGRLIFTTIAQHP